MSGHLKLTSVADFSGWAKLTLTLGNLVPVLVALVLMVAVPAATYGQSQATLTRQPRRASVQLAQNTPDVGEQSEAEEQEDEEVVAAEEGAIPPVPETPLAENQVPSEQQPPVAAEQPEATPFPGQPVGDKITVEADEVYYEAGATIGRGNVVVRGEELTVGADVVEIDEDKEWAQFHGNVVMESENQVTTAERLLINLDTEQWEIRQGRTQVEPEFFEKEQVLEPLFAAGQQVKGSGEGDLIEAFRGGLTSCNLPHPHYSVRSKAIELRPGRKVKIKKPSFYIGSTRVFWLPFNLVASLEEKKNRLIPELGQNNVEGYYAKLAYMYLAGQAAEGLVRLNLTQKRGIALGVDHSIYTDKQTGEGSILFEPSEGAMMTRLRHNYKFSPHLQSNLRGSYQQRSGYFGSTTSQSADLMLRHNDNNSDSQLGFQRYLNRSSYSTSRRFTTNFHWRQSMGSGERWGLQSNMRRYSRGAGEAADEELDAQFEYQRQLSHFDWQLLADNRYDLDGDAYTGDKHFGLHRLPEVTFNTDTRRLDGWKLLGRVPIHSSVQLGKYTQDPDNIKVTRGAIDTRLGGGTQRLSGSARLRTSGRYLQAFYDEGSAQYITTLNTTLEAGLGAGWESQLRYGYQSRRGFAPIRMDYAGRRQDVYLRTIRLKPDRSRIELSTGFDFIGDRWRDIRLSSEYMPSRESKFDLRTGYSLEYSRWRPLSLRFHQVHPPRFYLTLGTEYELDESELTRATMELDWLVYRKWRVELLTGYSGYRSEFDTLDVEVTREFHCWIASLAYSKQLDEIRLNLGLKAFPSPERILGVGRGGARFQSLPGQYF